MIQRKGPEVEPEVQSSKKKRAQRPGEVTILKSTLYKTPFMYVPCLNNENEGDGRAKE